MIKLLKNAAILLVMCLLVCCSIATPVTAGLPRLYTVHDIEYWVSPAGSDSNPGTESEPFLTIGHVISMIPELVRNDVFIWLDEGDWDETLDLQGRLCLAKLTIRGTTTDSLNHTINNLVLKDCIGWVEFDYIQFDTITTDALFISRCEPRVKLEYIIAVGECNYNGLQVVDHAVVACNSCVWSNKNIAIFANNMGQIHSNNSSGIGNYIGLKAAQGGLITKNSSQQPEAQIPEIKITGGSINWN